MSRIYDNWERLVKATLRREDFRLSSMSTPSEVSLASSFSTSTFTSFDLRPSSFNFSGLLVGDSFKYHQILQATDNLSEANLIKHGHSGDLYYGVLEGGVQVVVKKINLPSAQRGSYYFISELEILHKISHPRMVPLLGYCSENMNNDFLVYEYMPNKDLSSYLRRETGDDHGQLASLDWITRLKIAIGAAEGLCYLHHDCDPPIVHSILLDDNFEVRLGSLSEVCAAAETDPRETRFARFLRLPKAMRAGQSTSGASNATCADDVYCFGKLLLQLVTGKLRLNAATDFPDTIPPIGRPKNWKDLTLRIYDKELLRKAMDPSFIMAEDLFMEVWAVAIVARACLNPKPSRRPQMLQVLKALRTGKITDDAFLEMTRIIQSYQTFLGPISPQFDTGQF
ncbi:probable LRR receptor-like serine/threonine-protein kinase At2g16250 isoform X2 [Coffea eugenioides]|uniref:probable LRR receptor-like serine/threonine-protein kinase At2g16250 isoform X2 n=1 Tax=Coffea eugenioides TaxID=49369 RepID=UPI000F60F476|nr:probable LRR receptor-like serine/threonine-protein kinase At2g16250 isoform X2 [Coffea eugenioides]